MNYNYKATVVSVYDGDTITVHIDLGFEVWLRNQKLRLYGINTPEVRGIERPEGLRIRDQVRMLLPEGSTVQLQTYKDSKGKYGRWLADIITNEGVNVNKLLISQGYAAEY